MKTKIKKIITNIKHICSNANYKIRYNNLAKKYELLEEEIAEIKKKLSKEYMNVQLIEAQKQAVMYKRQRDQLRKDYIDLQNSTTSKGI